MARLEHSPEITTSEMILDRPGVQEGKGADGGSGSQSRVFFLSSFTRRCLEYNTKRAYTIKPRDG